MKIKEIEAERQSLIEKLNKKIREQRDADKKDVEKFRGNKDFDLRGYLDTFKKILQINKDGRLSGHFYVFWIL